MAEVKVEGEVGAGVAAVWELVRDFGAIGRWNPGLECTCDGTDVGAVREINMGGAVIRERLEALDDAARSFSYSILSGPIPVTDYLATVLLTDLGGNRTKVTWSSRYEPAGLPEADARKLLEGIYLGGIKGINRTLAG